MLRSVLVSLFFASAASAAPAAAQEGASDTSEEIVVTGQRTEEAIRGFVDQLAISSSGTDQLGRWDRRICPGVAGLRGRYAQFLIDRLAQRAFDVGLNVGEPGCRANVLIVVSTEPDSIAEELFDDHRGALGYFSERGQSTLGRDALRAFVRSDAPVRWWHVSRKHTNSGEAIGETGDGSPPVVFLQGNASRISRSTRQDFGAAFIIVDANRFAEIGADFGALADYIAMVTLAQVDPSAETQGLRTILNLFDGADPPRELTEWDVTYLRGLYAAERDDSAARQQSEIASSMGRELPLQ